MRSSYPPGVNHHPASSRCQPTSDTPPATVTRPCPTVPKRLAPEPRWRTMPVMPNALTNFAKPSGLPPLQPAGLLLLAAVVATAAWAEPPRSGTKYGQYAPDDAYESGSSLAYYGSENPWNRRPFERRRAARFPKRVGQRLLLMLDEKGPQATIAECRRWLVTRPDDAEVWFALTAAYSRANKLQEAADTMRRALELGLPIERFLAGPREWLGALVDSEPFQQRLARHPVRLVHGPMLGDVTSTSARFWVRVLRPTTVGVSVYLADGNQRIAQATARATSESDYTAVVHVTGLSPATRYTYRLTVGKETLPATHTFRTSIAPGQPVRFRAAFGGGAGYNPRNERIWDTIAQQHPDALFLLGDNVYIDLPQMPGPVHRYTYYRRQSRPEFRRLTATTPVYAIWDDHDCAIDDVWMGPYRDRPRWKQPMLALFRQNWVNPAYGAPEQPGCWFGMSVGDIDFFFLDGRFYRTNPYGEHPTMLGPVQRRWLLDGLAASRATFKVIVSPVPWAPGTKPGSRDTWDGFAEEREAIFQHIERHRIAGVLLVSADRHRSDAWRIDRPGSYPLYDVMSSRLTNVHKHECLDGALFCYNDKCSFGMLCFDTTLADPTFRYEIINIDGQSIHSLTLRRSQLEPKTN